MEKYIKEVFDEGLALLNYIKNKDKFNIFKLHLKILLIYINRIL